MVSRIYVERSSASMWRRSSFCTSCRAFLASRRSRASVINRYDVEGASDELFEQCVPTVFSEPQSDDAFTELPDAQGAMFAVEPLPGQFDQRAASASECIQLISQGERPEVLSAKVYVLEGELTDADIDAIKRYVINPIEAREASLATRETLKMEQPTPGTVEVVEGFRELDETGLAAFIAERGLAMDAAVIAFCRSISPKTSSATPRSPKSR